MERAFTLATLICVVCVFGAAEARKPVAYPTKATTTTTTEMPTQEHDKGHHRPSEDSTPRLIEHFDQRYVDGHYEYRYALSNGDTRYERAYWLPVGKTKVLARRGYYSYPMPNGKFMTVFYKADHQGYHTESSKFSKSQPTLPRSLEVPEYDPPVVVPAVELSTTTRRPTTNRPIQTTTTKRRRTTTKWPSTIYSWNKKVRAAHLKTFTAAMERQQQDRNKPNATVARHDSEGKDNVDNKKEKNIYINAATPTEIVTATEED